jgi:manganese-dependent inorganic pyrophosphatase
MRAMLLERMSYFCDKNGYSLLMLLVTDLNRGGSEVLLVGERKDIFYRAYSLESENESVFLPGVLSRKKQVVPLIMSIEDEI